MTKKIGIVGMGYVGRAMCALFAPHFHLVTYDPARPWNGENAGHDKGDFAGCDLAIICVPTPMASDGSADVSAVISSAHWLQEYCSLILIKSTVPPKTTMHLNATANAGVSFHFSPEYIGEGKNFVAPWRHPDPHDGRSHDFVIVGGPEADTVLTFFQAVMATDAHYYATDETTAELVKYAENAFLATKLRFCFELAEMAARFGVSYNSVRELWLADSRVGRSHTLVHPGQDFFSGKCLPKDLSAIVRAAHQAGAAVPMLSTIIAVNEARRKEVEG